MNPQLSCVSYACDESGNEFVCQFAQTEFTQADERHQKSAAAARRAMEEGHGRRNASVGRVPVDDHKQCSAAIKKGVGAQLSFVCRCSVTLDRTQGRTVQVPVRWPQESPPPFDAGNDADSRAGG